MNQLMQIEIQNFLTVPILMLPAVTWHTLHTNALFFIVLSVVWWISFY